VLEGRGYGHADDETLRNHPSIVCVTCHDNDGMYGKSTPLKMAPASHRASAFLLSSRAGDDISVSSASKVSYDCIKAGPSGVAVASSTKLSSPLSDELGRSKPCNSSSSSIGNEDNIVVLEDDDNDDDDVEAESDLAGPTNELQGLLSDPFWASSSFDDSDGNFLPKPLQSWLEEG
jgi:hypothetical protein